jgi:hypothetical protein
MDDIQKEVVRLNKLIVGNVKTQTVEVPTQVTYERMTKWPEINAPIQTILHIQGTLGYNNFVVDDAVYSELIGLNNKLIRQFNKALETVTVEELYQPEYPSMKEGIDLLTELREYFVANNLITSYAE